MIPGRSARTASRLFFCLLVCSTVVAQPQGVRQKTVQGEAGTIVVDQLATGLDHPWGMAFLPDGRLLVTERAGRLRILGLDGALSPPLAGTPDVFAKGQGGLLDVALDPGFAENRRVWLSFAEPGEGGASTALGHGRLQDSHLVDFEVVFRVAPKVDGPNHFGGRIAFDSGGNVFLTTGERYRFDPAQKLDNHLGTVVRITPAGAAPHDNPFTDQPEALDEIWSYGHRNIESAAINPATGDLWIAEMGPEGGDELNIAEAGRNFGWPEVSWGRHYDGRDIPDPPSRPEFADAIKWWTPVISPSGMVFYTGDEFPGWRGSVLIGGLTAKGIVRVKTDGDRVTGEERIGLGARVRDVEQGPGGAVYVLTDEKNGRVWRLQLKQ